MTSANQADDPMPPDRPSAEAGRAPAHPAPGDGQLDGSGRRGWTQAEIDAEIEQLGDVPMYQQDPSDGAEADQHPAGQGPERPVPEAADADTADLEATAVHRPFGDDPAPTPTRGSEVDLGAGTTAAERLEAYGWLFGDQRPPGRPRPPLWRQAGAAPDAGGPPTAPLTPVGVARQHPVAGAVPRPSAAATSPPARSAVAGRSADQRRRRGGRVALTMLVLAICLSLGSATAIVGFRMSEQGAPLAGMFGNGASASPQPNDGGAELGQVWDGAIAPIAGVTATATCVDPPGNDNGTPVPYEPTNLLDDDATTAWRCTGDGTPTVTFQVPEDATIAEVGLVNGYAKDVDGLDRYPLYQRALLVRWTFADGTSITQELTDDTRTVQTVRIPVRAGGSVTLEVLKVSNPSVQSATRDSLALSGVVILTPAG